MVHDLTFMEKRVNYNCNRHTSRFFKLLKILPLATYVVVLEFHQIGYKYNLMLEGGSWNILETVL